MVTGMERKGMNKELLCVLLTLSLLCAGVALAEETKNTVITFTVPSPQTDYTVIIPASMNFALGETQKSMNVAFGEGSTLAEDQSLSVRFVATENDFRLRQVDGDGSIAYTVEMEGAMLEANDAVLVWNGGSAMPAAKALTVTLNLTGSEPAGDYSDTLTFEVNLATRSGG